MRARYGPISGAATSRSAWVIGRHPRWPAARYAASKQPASRKVRFAPGRAAAPWQGALPARRTSVDLRLSWACERRPVDDELRRRTLHRAVQSRGMSLIVCRSIVDMRCVLARWTSDSAWPPTYAASDRRKAGHRKVLPSRHIFTGPTSAISSGVRATRRSPSWTNSRGP